MMSAITVLLFTKVFVNVGWGAPGTTLLGADGVRAIRELGVAGVRTDIHYDDEWVDRVVGELGSTGLEAILVVHGQTEEELLERALSALQAGHRHGVTGHIEVVNEPDLSGRWKKDPGSVGRVASRVSRLRATMGLNVQVILGGVSSLEANAQSYAAAMLRGVGPDAAIHVLLGFHDYRDPRRNPWEASRGFASRVQEWQAFDRLRTSYGVFAATCTEFGYPTDKVSEDRQWELIRYTLDFHSLNRAMHSVIYQLRDGPAEKLGLYDLVWRPKRAARALGAYISSMETHR